MSLKQQIEDGIVRAVNRLAIETLNASHVNVESSNHVALLPELRKHFMKISILSRDPFSVDNEASKAYTLFVHLRDIIIFRIK